MDLTKDLEKQIAFIEAEFEKTKTKLAGIEEARSVLSTKLVDLRGQRKALQEVIEKLESEKPTKDK